MKSVSVKGARYTAKLSVLYNRSVPVGEVELKARYCPGTTINCSRDWPSMDRKRLRLPTTSGYHSCVGYNGSGMFTSSVTMRATMGSKLGTSVYEPPSIK